MRLSESKQPEEEAAALLKTSEVGCSGLGWRRQAIHPNIAVLICPVYGWLLLTLSWSIQFKSLLTGTLHKSPIFYSGSLLMGSTAEHYTAVWTELRPPGVAPATPGLT